MTASGRRPQQVSVQAAGPWQSGIPTPLPRAFRGADPQDGEGLIPAVLGNPGSPGPGPWARQEAMPGLCCSSEEA